jgi:hypothetical protein
MQSARIVTYRDPARELWFAQLGSKKHTRVSGKSQSEAVGRLVVAKHRMLRVQIVRDESKDL